MDASRLQDRFLELDDREAVLRHVALYIPNGCKTRAELEGRLPTEEDERELFGTRLWREMSAGVSASTTLITTRGRIVSNVFFLGEPHRAVMIRTKAEGLARLAVDMLPAGLLTNALGDAIHDVKALHKWLIAVHILTRRERAAYSPTDSNGVTRTWRFEPDGFPPSICHSLLENVGAQSCKALDILGNPPLPIVANVQAGTVTVNGIEHRDVNATTCRIVVELLEAKGCDVRWCDLEIRCGKRGMNRTRERDKVREIVGDYLKSGRNGFRLTF